MKFRLLRLAILSLLLTVPACSSTPTPAAPPVESDLVTELTEPLVIPFGQQGLYRTVRVRVNGQPAGDWLFDTGSNLTVVDTGVAGRLGLEVVGEAETVGIGGTDTFVWYEIDTLSLADRNQHLDLRHPQVGGLSMYHSVGGGTFRGLMGYTALQRHPFTVDQQNNRLIIYPRRGFQPPDSPRIRIVPFRRLPTVEADLGEGRRVWLILDTGANNHLTLPTEALEQWPDMLSTPHAGATRSRGIGGTVHGQTSWVGELNVFGLTLRDVPVQIEPSTLNRPPGTPPVGRIGNELLENFRLTFDPARRVMWAEFLPAGAGR